MGALGPRHLAGTMVRQNVLTVWVSQVFPLLSIITISFADERPYDPRPYDSRYTRDFDRRGRHDDHRRDDRERYRDYERDRYRDYDRGRYDDRRY